MAADNQPKNTNVQIKITDEQLRGFYSNLVQIVHTKEEFILDFMNVVGQQGIVGSRVTISPGHAKRIINALTQNLKKYEEQFGTIPEGSSPSGDKTFGFQSQS
jgi:hypothetical protein